MDLKDAQWTIVEPLIPKPHVRPDGRGRPWRHAREVLNGILWVLRTGAPWQDMPDRYPSPATCHRRFQAWVRGGVFEKILAALAADLRDRGTLDLSECFVDATFVGAKKGGFAWAPTKRGKGSKLMAVVDGHGLPVAIDVASASPAEVRLVTSTLQARFVPELPERLIGDKAYDSDALAEELAQHGIELIAPNRKNRRVKTPGWSPAPPLSSPLEDRATLCLAAELPSPGQSLGVRRR